MDVNPFSAHDQRRRKKRQEFKQVLRALIEGVADLVEGQRCFADEFGLSYGRVFHDDFESFKGKDASRVISEWLRNGEEGAVKMQDLFKDLSEHQMALVEAADEVARESIEIGGVKRHKLAKSYSLYGNVKYSKKKSRKDLHQALHQQVIVNAFATGYAKSREQMKANSKRSGAGFVAGKAVF